MAIKGTLAALADLITKEIDQLDQLEHQSLSSDLAQGFALNTLTYIFGSFLNKDPIKRVFKGRLLSTVLHGYLSLRRYFKKLEISFRYDLIAMLIFFF